MSSVRKKPSMDAMLRKGAAFIHLWLGLILGLYFSVIGLTGSLLVFETDLRAREMPEIVRVSTPTPAALPLPIADILTQLHQDYPQIPLAQLYRLQIPETREGAYSLSYGDYAKPLEMRMLTIDPYTGKVLQNRAARDSFIGFNRVLHGSLLLGMKGTVANGIGAGLTVFLLLSGLWLWWPKTMSQLRVRSTVRWKAARTMHDLHNVMGIYPLPLLIVLSFTGIVLAFYGPVQQTVYAWTKTVMPAEPSVPAHTSSDKPLPVETLLRVAEQTLPEARITGFSYPTEENAPFTCSKEYSLIGFSNYAEVIIDPYTARVLQVQDERKAGIGERIMRVLCNLHFGWWGGIFTRILYCLSGLLPLSLFITGIVIYTRKLSYKIKKTRTPKQIA